MNFIQQILVWNNNTVYSVHLGIPSWLGFPVKWKISPIIWHSVSKKNCENIMFLEQKKHKMRKIAKLSHILGFSAKFRIVFTSFISLKTLILAQTLLHLNIRSLLTFLNIRSLLNLLLGYSALIESGTKLHLDTPSWPRYAQFWPKNYYYWIFSKLRLFQDWIKSYAW